MSQNSQMHAASSDNQFVGMIFCSGRISGVPAVIIPIKTDGQYLCSILFSQEQARAFWEIYGRRDAIGMTADTWLKIKTELNNAENLPETSDRDPIVIISSVAAYIARCFEKYTQHSRGTMEDMYWEAQQPEVMAFIYMPKNLSENGDIDDKDLLLLLQDKERRHHIFVAFSQQEVMRILAQFPELRDDLEEYERTMRNKSTLPVASDRETISISGPELSEVAHRLAEYMVISRWFVQMENPR